MSGPPSVVFDLDQTLIRGEAADWSLWLAAVGAALDVEVPADQDWAGYAVHTDHGLVAELSERLRGRRATPEELAACERLYVDGVAREACAFTPIDGAVEMLERLASLGVPTGIATGNTPEAARIKLRAAGLDRLALPCACSAEGLDRAGLVHECLLMVGWRPGRPAVSVGDGLWDLRAARALGIAFVGVAGSDAREALLRRHGARHVVRDFTDVAAFRAMLGV